ncbi:MAG: hypothetical protein GXO40_06715 [Epsilonproteobacteria bacterium]|nr:hypothetical protein [Campylobacterota bacterium]
MRLLLSFLLSSVIYAAIVFFFVYLITNQKHTKPQVVYIHQAIISPTVSKNITIKKTQQKKIAKTADEFSQGGEDIKFDDIFSTVSDQIKTTKIKHKKRKNMTKQIGHNNLDEVKKILSKLKTTLKVSSTSGETKDIDYMQSELTRVWNSVETDDGDFIKIQIVVHNHQLSYSVIATNLPQDKLHLFLENLSRIDVSKLNNLTSTINFTTKADDK